MFDYETLKNSMADLDEDTVLETLRELIDNGGEDASRAMEACQDGLTEVGTRFDQGDYFIGDLIYAGEIMSESMEILKPVLIQEGDGQKCGRVILATVHGDLHDIGKNIVRAMLEAAGFDVVDLGIDVAPEVIVETAKKENINIIALSGVLTLAIGSMKDTVDAFKNAGMREQVHIIIGGTPVSEGGCQVVGADEWAHSPQKTVNVCKGWAAGK